jgi:hypothetical protein
MRARRRIIDYLAAASIVLAFGGLFFGRLMLYPVAIARGGFLERLAARSQEWDLGHRVMLLGMMALIGATIGLRRALRTRSPWLVDIAAGLTIAGAALGVGQYALDFAMLAAARVEPRTAGEQFVELLRADSFVQLAFYTLPDVGQLGLILFTIVLWLQGAGWRPQAALVTLAAATALVGPLVFGAMGVRVGLGLAFVGFSTVAWKIAAGSAEPTDAPG